MNSSNLLSKKTIAYFGVALFALGAIVWFGSHGRLTIYNTAPGSDFTNASLTTPGGTQKMVLIPGSRKAFWLARGSYQINFQSGDKESISYVSVPSFSNKKIKISLVPQKASLSLGSASYACAYNPGIVYYYPCELVNKVDIVSSSDGLSYPSSFPESSESINNVAKTILPYMNGFLEFRDTGSNLNITNHKVSSAGLVAEPWQSLKLEKPLTSLIVATDKNNISNSKVGIIIPESRRLFVYTGSSSRASLVDLSKTFSVDELKTARILLSNSTFYILSGIREQNLAEVQRSDAKPLKQRITVINDHSVVKGPAIKDELTVRDAWSDSSGQLVLKVLKNKASSESFYRIVANKLNLLPISAGLVSKACSSNSSGFYYLQGLHSLYYYSIPDEASTLVYQDSANSLANLSCLYGSTYLATTRQDSPTLYYHLQILGRDLGGSRPESILPIEGDSINDILSATIFKQTINIRLVNSAAYDNRNDPTYKAPSSVDPQHEQRVLGYLKTRGIDTTKYIINFSY